MRFSPRRNWRTPRHFSERTQVMTRLRCGASVSPYVLNPESRNRSRHHALFAPEELEDAQAFFRTYPGYDPTPLRRLPSYAKELGVGELLVKDESRRMGLNAFKILGVSYAIHRMQLAGEISSRSILACATDGNHGRAG